MSTVSDIFNQFHLVQWWQINRVTQFFGQNGEQGADYGLTGFGVPVGSITSGRVVYVGDGGYPGSSIGQVVQVLSPDGVYHYQHLQSSSVIMGQTVHVGDIIGTSGGCPSGCYGQNPSCTCYDQYSSGQHIEVRYSSSYNQSADMWHRGNWTNPVWHFMGLAGGTGIPGTGVAGQSNSSSNDIGTQLKTFSIGIGQKVGLIVVGLTLIIVGSFLLFPEQVKGIAKKAANIAIPEANITKVLPKKKEVAEKKDITAKETSPEVKEAGVTESRGKAIDYKEVQSPLPKNQGKHSAAIKERTQERILSKYGKEA
jgi:hypothetical protein